MADNNDRQAPQADQPFDSPSTAMGDQPEKEPRLAAAREWWDNAWTEGGGLYEVWEELRQAPAAGWHGMAHWIKALLAVAGFSFAVLLLQAAGTVVLDALQQLFTAAPRLQVGTDTSTGVWAVIDQPVRTYIAQHSDGLAISASTLYTLWQAAGLVGLIGGFLRNTGARLTWVGWGAASIAMVWSAAPADGRTLATGIAALLWTLASMLALRGLTLRPAVLTHIYNAAPEIRPQIHIPAPAAPLADDTPDNVHPLQR